MKPCVWFIGCSQSHSWSFFFAHPLVCGRDQVSLLTNGIARLWSRGLRIRAPAVIRTHNRANTRTGKQFNIKHTPRCVRLPWMLNYSSECAVAWGGHLAMSSFKHWSYSSKVDNIRTHHHTRHSLYDCIAEWCRSWQIAHPRVNGLTNIAFAVLRVDCLLSDFLSLWKGRSSLPQPLKGTQLIPLSQTLILDREIRNSVSFLQPVKSAQTTTGKE